MAYNAAAALNQDLAMWLLARGAHQGSSTWPDETGNGNDGVLTDMDPSTDWVSDSPPGGFGSLDFAGDGSNDIVRVPDVPANPSTGITVVTWAVVDDASHDSVRFWTTVDASTADRRIEVAVANDGSVRLEDDVGGSRTVIVDVAGAITLGAWHQIALTADVSGWVLYLDGTSVASGTEQLSDGVADAIGGHENIRSRDELDGRVSDHRLLNTVWTATEVSDYYDESLAGYPNTWPGAQAMSFFSQRARRFSP